MARTRRDEPFDDVQKLELETIGPLLFGRMWQTQMAELIGENQRYVSRCVEEPPRARLLPEQRDVVRAALERRLKDVQAALAMFDAHDKEMDWAA